MARAQPFTVELFPFVGVDGLDEIWNDLVYPLCFFFKRSSSRYVRIANN